MEEAESRSVAALERVVDLDGFVAALDSLRLGAGSPPYRSLAKRIGELIRPPREVPFRTVADLFKSGRRRVDLDLVVATVRALGVDSHDVGVWRQACIRAQLAEKSGGLGGVLRQLAADLSKLAGRACQNEAITAAAADTECAVTVVISSIEGLPGLRETQIAVHFVQRPVHADRHADAQQNPERHAKGASMTRQHMHGMGVIIVLDDANRITVGRGADQRTSLISKDPP